MAALTSTPLSDFSKNWTFLPQEMQPLEAKSTSGSRGDAREQVEVPGGTFDFQVKGGNSIAFKFCILGIVLAYFLWQFLGRILGHIFHSNCDLFLTNYDLITRQFLVNFQVGWQFLGRISVHIFQPTYPMTFLTNYDLISRQFWVKL